MTKMYGIFEVRLPRSARKQFCAGSKVDKDDLAVGDLVFFKTKPYAQYPTHVGIYIGNGQFIHTSSFTRRGSESIISRMPISTEPTRAP